LDVNGSATTIRAQTEGRRRDRWRLLWWFLVGVAGTAWLLVALFLFVVDVATVSDTPNDPDLLSCHVDGTDSEYGSSTWSWFPPGKVCHAPDGATDRPQIVGELAVLAVFGVGAAAIVVAVRGCVHASVADR
jgi:hypothetical protein